MVFGVFFQNGNLALRANGPVDRPAKSDSISMFSKFSGLVNGIHDLIGIKILDQNKTEKGFFKVGEWFLDYHQLKKGNDQKYRQNIQEGLEKFEE